MEAIVQHPKLAPFREWAEAEPVQAAVARQIYFEVTAAALLLPHPFLRPRHPRIIARAASERAEWSQVARWGCTAQLSEVRRWNSVEVYRCDELDIIYLVGAERPGMPLECVLPAPSHAQFGMEKFAQYFEKIVKAHGSRAPTKGEVRPNCLVIATADSDSTTAMYRMFHGLRAPPESVVVDADDDPG